MKKTYIEPSVKSVIINVEANIAALSDLNGVDLNDAGEGNGSDALSKDYFDEETNKYFGW